MICPWSIKDREFIPPTNKEIVAGEEIFGIPQPQIASIMKVVQKKYNFGTKPHVRWNCNPPIVAAIADSSSSAGCPPGVAADGLDPRPDTQNPATG
jgi:hypothetical protein